MDSSRNLSPSTQLILDGYLEKKSPKTALGMSVWQHRYFQLYEDVLVYKKSEDPQEIIIGAIPLAFILSVNYDEEKSLKTKNKARFDIIVVGEGRKFSLRAPTKDICDNWINKINRQIQKATKGDVKTTDEVKGIFATIHGKNQSNAHDNDGITNFWKLPKEVLLSVKMFRGGNVLPSGPSKDNVVSKDGSHHVSPENKAKVTSEKQSYEVNQFDSDQRDNDPAKKIHPSHSSRGLHSRNSSISVRTVFRNSFDNSAASNFNGNIGSEMLLADFAIIDILGHGSYGKMFRARIADDYQSSRIYILQIVKESSANFEKGRRSIESMAGIQHPFIIRQYFKGYDVEKKALWAAWSYAGSGSLWHLIRIAKRLEEHIARFFAAEIALAISYVHKKGISIRGLNSENIWLDDDGHGIICDMGFAISNIHEVDLSGHWMKVTEYTSPESIPETKNLEYANIGSDWWKLGVLLYEMLVGIPPFRGKSEKDLRKSILEDEVRFPPFITMSVRQLITDLLCRDPSSRLGSTHGFEEIKNHSFFQDINWTELAKAKRTSVPFSVSNLIEQMRLRENDSPGPVGDNSSEDSRASRKTLQSNTVKTPKRTESMGPLLSNGSNLGSSITSKSSEKSHLSSSIKKSPSSLKNSVDRRGPERSPPVYQEIVRNTGSKFKQDVNSEPSNKSSHFDRIVCVFDAGNQFSKFTQLKNTNYCFCEILYRGSYLSTNPVLFNRFQKLDPVWNESLQVPFDPNYPDSNLVISVFSAPENVFDLEEMEQSTQILRLGSFTVDISPLIQQVQSTLPTEWYEIKDDYSETGAYVSIRVYLADSVTLDDEIVVIHDGSDFDPSVRNSEVRTIDHSLNLSNDISQKIYEKAQKSWISHQVPKSLSHRLILFSDKISILRDVQITQAQSILEHVYPNYKLQVIGKSMNLNSKLPSASEWIESGFYNIPSMFTLIRYWNNVSTYLSSEKSPMLVLLPHENCNAALEVCIIFAAVSLLSSDGFLDGPQSLEHVLSIMKIGSQDLRPSLVRYFQYFSQYFTQHILDNLIFVWPLSSIILNSIIVDARVNFSPYSDACVQVTDLSGRVIAREQVKSVKLTNRGTKISTNIPIKQDAFIELTLNNESLLRAAFNVAFLDEDQILILPNESDWSGPVPERAAAALLEFSTGN